MKTITIRIPDMQSTHCQARVSSALKAIDGLTIEQQQAGFISLSLSDEALEATVTGAIEKAGYTVESISENQSFSH